MLRILDFVVQTLQKSKIKCVAIKFTGMNSFFKWVFVP